MQERKRVSIVSTDVAFRCSFSGRRATHSAAASAKPTAAAHHAATHWLLLLVHWLLRVSTAVSSRSAVWTCLLLRVTATILRLLLLLAPASLIATRRCTWRCAVLLLLLLPV